MTVTICFFNSVPAKSLLIGPSNGRIKARQNRGCTIKFVYYKSFCVGDDIGSYIRTVYHMVSHTPKQGVARSNRANRTR